MKYKIELGDALAILKNLDNNSCDSVVTDPPAGIGLNSLEWDEDKGGREEWISWLSGIMRECYRVLKPGAHGFVWALPRTSHWTATALEDSGFLVKDIITHIYGSGFPKNIAIDKAIAKAKHKDTSTLYQVTEWIRLRRDELGLTNREMDEAAGVKGGACHWTAKPPKGQPHIPTIERWQRLEPLLGPAPDWMKPLLRPAHEMGSSEAAAEAAQWVGWGTALKPSSEHWILIQKPISEHNLAANVRRWNAGGINIDGSRVPVRERIPSTTNLCFKGGGFIWNGRERSETSIYTQHPKGRHPANLIVTRTNDENCPSKKMREQSDLDTDVAEYFKNFKPETPFFYAKKAGKIERGEANTHPTVKPLRLMRYLARMVTPPGGWVLDPFMGSGTTGVAALFEGFSFIGIEANDEYFRIAHKRLKGVKNE